MKTYQVLTFLILVGIIFSCNFYEDSRINNFPFYSHDEYFDGNGSYPFPDGVYVKYKHNRSHDYNSAIILLSVDSTGVEILEAWSIRAIKKYPYTKLYIYPNLYLLLKNREQPVDTTDFNYIEKPGLGTEANIRHYFFY